MTQNDPNNAWMMVRYMSRGTFILEEKSSRPPGGAVGESSLEDFRLVLWD